MRCDYVDLCAQTINSFSADRGPRPGPFAWTAGRGLCGTPRTAGRGQVSLAAALDRARPSQCDVKAKPHNMFPNIVRVGRSAVARARFRYIARRSTAEPSIKLNRLLTCCGRACRMFGSTSRNEASWAVSFQREVTSKEVNCV